MLRVNTLSRTSILEMSCFLLVVVIVMMLSMLEGS
jgi:hypothetical protein